MQGFYAVSQSEQGSINIGTFYHTLTFIMSVACPFRTSQIYQTETGHYLAINFSLRTYFIFFKHSNFNQRMTSRTLQISLSFFLNSLVITSLNKFKSLFKRFDGMPRQILNLNFSEFIFNNFQILELRTQQISYFFIVNFKIRNFKSTISLLAEEPFHQSHHNPLFSFVSHHAY